MTQQQCAVPAGKCAERVLPGRASRNRQKQLRKQPPHDRFEQRVLRREVPVERHGLDAERGPQMPHRKRLETTAIDELDRGVADPLGSERLPP